MQISSKDFQSSLPLLWGYEKVFPPGPEHALGNPVGIYIFTQAAEREQQGSKFIWAAKGR
jgi:hypothetical protein